MDSELELSGWPKPASSSSASVVKALAFSAVGLRAENEKTTLGTCLINS